MQSVRSIMGKPASNERKLFLLDAADARCEYYISPRNVGQFILTYRPTNLSVLYRFNLIYNTCCKLIGYCF